MGLLAKLFKGSSRVNVRSRFELLREAISGTMSSFYMARDRSTKEIVGLKILDRQKTAALEGRFTGISKPTEGEIALALSHPYIVKTYEHGLNERTVVIEFENLAKAIAAYDTPDYRQALRALADGAERDLRIVEGL